MSIKEVMFLRTPFDSLPQSVAYCGCKYLKDREPGKYRACALAESPERCERGSGGAGEWAGELRAQ
jgi:hypothetical protein